MLLFLLGCVENKLHGSPDAAGVEDSADSSPGLTDSGDSSPGDSLDSSIHCPDAVPADDVEPISADCAGIVTPFTGEFVELWRTRVAGMAIELHAAHMKDGNGDGVVDTSDPMQIIVDDVSGQVDVLDSDGSTLSAAGLGSYMVTSTTGDLDPNDDGAEVLLSGWYWRGEAYLGVAGEAGGTWMRPLRTEAWLYPWLTDLDGDGVAEALVENRVFDPLTGDLLATLDAPFTEDVSPPISADLDRDGTEEIFASPWSLGEVDMFHADGTLLATCVHLGGNMYNASYAVGNLDDDNDGELVAAGSGYLAICDADGTPLGRVTAFEENQPALVGLGQLDGESKPEIVVSYEYGISAFDTDLSTLWTWTSSNRNWTGFSLADLDGDGLHEILVNDGGTLVVLDHSGATLASYVFDTLPGSAWKDQPIVVDVDGDGLAEIVVGGYDIVALESPEGGYPIPGAQFDWPGPDHHPGDRTASGGLPGPTAFWLEPQGNVWQGLAPGVGQRPDLTVTIPDVCVESCDGEAIVLVRVANASASALDREVTVTLQALDGDVLGTAAVTSLAGGTGHYVAFPIPAEELAVGLQATVDSGEQATECAEANNLAEYRDTPCP